jgi:N-acetylglucosamine-6-phosphate deacetylase
MLTALVNGRVLTDSGFVSGRAVLLQDGRILDVVSEDDSRIASARQRDLYGNLLLPGFIDTQVNGGGGVLFNDDPSVEAIRAIGAAHRRFGTTGFLPTLISDDLEVVARAVAAVKAAIDAGVPGVLGIHIEGPFLNVERKGVHDPAKLRELDESAVDLLTSLKNGKTLVTLAPEMTTPAIIRRLAAAGVVVSAGHSNATHAQIAEALQNGLTGFTHLFNAMSQLTGREPGVVGAALEHAESWCGLIVDGYHVAPVVMRLALRCKSHDRFMIVTDGMPSIGTSDTSFDLQGRSISVVGGQLLDEMGRLAGSHTDMITAVRNATGMLEVDVPTAVRMASRNPATFLGLDHDLGRIAPRCRANLVLTDVNLNVLDTWIDGHSSAGQQDSRHRP